MFSFLTHFLSIWLQCVVVGGCQSELMNVVSVVLQGSVLGPQLLLLYTAENREYILYTSVSRTLYAYRTESRSCTHP